MVDDSSEEGKDNKRGGEDEDQREGGRETDKPVGVARHKRPDDARGVRRNCAESNDIPFQVEEMLDAMTALVESMTGESGMTVTKVDARVDEKLKKTNRFLQQQAYTMPKLKDMMRALIARYLGSSMYLKRD